MKNSVNEESKNLVIVESPSKAKTINKYLGKDYKVEATIGHVKDLPKSKFGIDIENNFKLSLTNIRGKSEILNKLKELAKKSKKIYIATDPDREGEAIAQDIAEIIAEKGNVNQDKIYRALFYEITKSGVKKALESPEKINLNKVSAQRARRALDRIIGYKVSPILWQAALDAAGDSLSAGRVQTVALRLVCERELEIRNFKPVEYWNILAIFETSNKDKIKSKLFEIDDKQLKVLPKSDLNEEELKIFLEKNTCINSQRQAEEIAERILNVKSFIIDDVIKKETKKNPAPPFITSSLQAEASKKLRFSPKQTMMLAQQLYEGIELGSEGYVGLITYMRTDSVRISYEFLAQTRNFILDKFGQKYLPESPRIYTKKTSAKVQDAHEAIRPTSLKYSPEFVKPYLDKKQYDLYELIWKRYLASQMSSAVFDSITAIIRGDEFGFKTSGMKLLFDGFLSLYEEQVEDYEAQNEDYFGELSANINKGQSLLLNEIEKIQSFTKPPARFTESSLIKELEANGVGRPSTYATIVSTIEDRKYVRLEDRKLVPTDLGFKVYDFLINKFPNIFEVGFTAKMEEELDLIENGEMEYAQVLQEFYEPFSKELSNAENSIEKVLCDKCGSEMVIKIGRFGKFLACSNYPTCSNIKSLKQFKSKEEEAEYVGESCPSCGAQLVYRYGKFGKFIGCEKYPECKYIRTITLEVKCPKCKDGDIIVKTTKRKKIFYGCSNFPKCDFASWDKIANQACPSCGNSYMIEKVSKKKGTYLSCPSCKHEIILESSEEKS